jgi:hypothetical protein
VSAGAIDDAMRLWAGPVFANGFLELFAAVFTRLFEADFFAGAAGVTGSGVSAGLEADEVADFLAAVFDGVLAGVGALSVAEDFLAGAFLPAAFLAAAAEAVEAGAGAVSAFSGVGNDAFVRELIFSANDFFWAEALRGAAAGLAFDDAWAGLSDAEVVAPAELA